MTRSCYRAQNGGLSHGASARRGQIESCGASPPRGMPPQAARPGSGQHPAWLVLPSVPLLLDGPRPNYDGARELRNVEVALPDQVAQIGADV